MATVLISDWSPCLRVSRSALPERLPTLVYISTILSTYCPSVPAVPGEWPGAVTRGAGERSQDTASRVTRVTRVTGRSHAVITTHISRDTILGSRGGGGFIFSRNMQTTVDNLHTLEDCSTSCCSASHQYPTPRRVTSQRKLSGSGHWTFCAVAGAGWKVGHSDTRPCMPSAVLYR